jgi:hypothetical protein
MTDESLGLGVTGNDDEQRESMPAGSQDTLTSGNKSCAGNENGNGDDIGKDRRPRALYKTVCSSHRKGSFHQKGIASHGESCVLGAFEGQRDMFIRVLKILQML